MFVILFVILLMDFQFFKRNSRMVMNSIKNIFLIDQKILILNKTPFMSRFLVNVLLHT